MPNITPIGAQWNSSGGVPINNPGTGQVPLQFTPVSTHADPAQFDDVGQAITKLGETGQNISEQMIARRNKLAEDELTAFRVVQTHKAVAETKIGLAQLENDLLAANDPHNFQQNFEAKSAELITAKLDSLTDDPIVKREYQKDMFTYMGAKMPEVINRARIERIREDKAQAEDTLNLMKEAMVNEPNPVTRRGYLENMLGLLTSSRAAGLISQPEAAKFQSDVLKDMDMAEITRMKREAPELLPDLLDAGSFKNLDAHALETQRTEVRHLLQAKWDKEERYAEKQMKLQHEANTIKFDTEIRAFMGNAMRTGEFDPVAYAAMKTRLSQAKGRDISYAEFKELDTLLSTDPEHFARHSNPSTKRDLQNKINAIELGDLTPDALGMVDILREQNDGQLSGKDASTLIDRLVNVQKTGGILATEPSKFAFGQLQKAFHQNEFDKLDTEKQDRYVAANDELRTRILNGEKPNEALAYVLDPKSGYNHAEDSNPIIKQIRKNNPGFKGEPTLEQRSRAMSELIREGKVDPEILQPELDRINADKEQMRRESERLARESDGLAKPNTVAIDRLAKQQETRATENAYAATEARKAFDQEQAQVDAVVSHARTLRPDELESILKVTDGHSNPIIQKMRDGIKTVLDEMTASDRLPQDAPANSVSSATPPTRSVPSRSEWDKAGFDDALKESNAAMDKLKRPAEAYTIEEPGKKGKFVNIPSVWDGKKLSEKDAVERAAINGFTDPATGQSLQSFASREEAATAAQQQEPPMGGPTSAAPTNVYNYRQRAQRAEAVASGNRVTHEVTANGKKYQVSTLPDELKDPSGELTKLIDAIYVAEGVDGVAPKGWKYWLYGRKYDGKQGGGVESETYNRSLALDHAVFGVSKFMEKFGEEKLKDEQGRYSEAFIDFLWKGIERDKAKGLGSYSPGKENPNWGPLVKSSYYGSE